MKHFWDFISGPQWVLLLVTVQTTSCFSSVCPPLSVPPSRIHTPTNTQQWVRPVPERRRLLLHQDLLWDDGRQLRTGSLPAGSGPGLVLSSQLGFLWFSSGFGASDPAGAQAQVQLNFRPGPEQAQSAQPVSPQQLLADPLRASLSGGCSSVFLSR